MLHCTVVALPLNGSKGGGDLVLKQNLLLLCVHVNQVVLMQTSCIYMRKAERFVSK